MRNINIIWLQYLTSAAYYKYHKQGILYAVKKALLAELSDFSWTWYVKSFCIKKPYMPDNNVKLNAKFHFLCPCPRKLSRWTHNPGFQNMAGNSPLTNYHKPDRATQSQEIACFSQLFVIDFGRRERCTVTSWNRWRFYSAFFRRVDFQFHIPISSLIVSQTSRTYCNSDFSRPLWTENRIRERVFGVAGAIKTDPKTPLFSRASRRSSVSDSRPPSMDTIWDWLEML